MGLFLRVILKFGPNLASSLGTWAYILLVILNFRPNFARDFCIWAYFLRVIFKIGSYFGPILLGPKEGLGHVPQVPLR